jgi:hypothetical protein
LSSDSGKAERAANDGHRGANARDSQFTRYSNALQLGPTLSRIDASAGPIVELRRSWLKRVFANPIVSLAQNLERETEKHLREAIHDI